MRGAVTLAPAQGLATGAAAVQQLLASCVSPATSPAARHSHMEAAVFLLECLAGPLAEGPAAQQPALADGLAALLQQMLALRVNDAVCITLVRPRRRVLAPATAYWPAGAPRRAAAGRPLAQLAQLAPARAGSPPPPPPSRSTRAASRRLASSCGCGRSWRCRWRRRASS
jgi:hypothetical protein